MNLSLEKDIVKHLTKQDVPDEIKEILMQLRPNTNFSGNTKQDKEIVNEIFDAIARLVRGIN
jgi:hypothetical protein